MSEENLTSKYNDLLPSADLREAHPLTQALNNFDESEASSNIGETVANPIRKGSRLDQRSSVGSTFNGDRHTDALNQQYADSPDRLAGDVTIPYVQLKEKPWHRVLVYLAAQGLSARKQCENFGGEFHEDTNQYISGSGNHAYGTIANINRQPWFKAKVVAALRDAGGDEIAAILESEVVPSLVRLRELRDNTATPASVQLSATKEFLDRFLGKSAQPYMTPPSLGKDPEEEAAQIEAEIARLSDNK
jgi:hypothetical protein